MRHSLFNLTVFAIVFGMSGTVQSAEGGLYLGASIGSTSTSVSNYDSAGSYRVFGGYRVEGFSVEGGYTDLGQLDIKSGGNSSISVDGIQLGVVAEAYMNESLDAYGSVGFYQWNMDKILLGIPTSDDGTSPFLGAGLKVKMSDELSIRGGWERFTDIADDHYDLLTLGAIFKF
jgi:hypothetical protein